MEFDVVIIGGGVAGASLAIQLTSAGHHVAIVERAALGSNKLSTHFLWPRGVSYLNRLGIDPRKDLGAPLFKNVRFSLEGHQLAAQVSLSQTKARLSQTHGHSTGATQEYTCVRRQVLDRVLVNKAVAQGACLFQGYQLRVISKRDSGDRVSAVEIKNRVGHKVCLSAKIFVAADGRESTFARLSKNPIIEESLNSTSTVWTYFECLPAQEVRLAKRGDRGFGAASTNEGLTMVLYWGPSADAKNIASLKEPEFRSRIQQMDPEFGAELSGARKVEGFYRASHLASFKRKSIHAGVFFLGDAACFKDQCTASGITHALCDAEIAHEEIDQYLQKKKPRERSEWEFSERRELDRGSYFKLACAMAAMVPATRDEVATHRMAAKDPGAASGFITLCADSNALAATAKIFHSDDAKSTHKEIYHDPIQCTFI